MEMRMTRELALRLGAITLEDIDEKKLSGPWLVLFDERGRTLYWPILKRSSCEQA